MKHIIKLLVLTLGLLQVCSSVAEEGYANLNGIKRPYYSLDDSRALVNNREELSQKLPPILEFVQPDDELATDNQLLQMLQEEYAEAKKALHSTAELTNFYRYILTSFLAYKEKADSEDEGYHKGLEARLRKVGLENATDADIPAHWLTEGIFETGKNGTKNRVYNKKFLGVKARIFFNHDERRIIIAYTGTEFNNGITNFASSFSTAVWVHGGYGYGYIGQIPNYMMQTLSWLTSWVSQEPLVEPDYKLVEIPMLTQALEFSRDLKAMYPDYKLELTGSSLGGSIAQYVAIKLKCKAYVFNSLALNSAIVSQLQLEEPDLAPLEEYISHAWLDGEVLNDSYYSYFVQGAVPFYQGFMPGQGTEIPFTEVTATNRLTNALYDQDVSSAALEIPAVLWETLTGNLYRHGAPALLEAIEGKLDMSLPPLKRNGQKVQ